MPVWDNERIMLEQFKHLTANTLFEKFLWWIALSGLFTYKVIYTNQDPYLLRVYLYRGKWFRHIYLHFFFRGDKDREHHNHPANVKYPSRSLILTRGYLEERVELGRQGKLEVVIRDVVPWTINTIYHNTFHKVTLAKGSCWTLFFPGWVSVDPSEEVWWFLDVETGKCTFWVDYIKERENDHH